MRLRRLITLLAALLALTPGAAMAGSDASLICVGGAVQSGTSLLNVPPCDGYGITQPFSNLMCITEDNINTILGNMYCGVQGAMLAPLEAMLILYVIFFGIKMALGYVRIPITESLVHLLKFCLVWIFATDSAWGIGVAYNFFITIIKSGTGWMLGAIPNQSATSTYDAFGVMDTLIYGIFNQQATGANAGALVGFISALSYLVPPVFFMFVYFFVKSIIILVRALLSYLLGISVIAFLMTMSPLFFSLALFAPTRQFFEDWLRYIISFTLQVVLIFAGVAMWFIMVNWLGNAFFTTLSNMIVPFYNIATVGSLSVPLNEWAFCTSGMAAGGVCSGGPADTMMMSQIAQDPVVNIPTMNGAYGSGAEALPFLSFIVYNITIMCIVAYCFDTLMKMIPNLARQLAGPAYAPQLGVGYSQVGMIHYPGMSKLSGMGTGMGKRFIGSGGNLFEKIGAAMSGVEDPNAQSVGNRTGMSAFNRMQGAQNMVNQRTGPDTAK